MSEIPYTLNYALRRLEGQTSYYIVDGIGEVLWRYYLQLKDGMTALRRTWRVSSPFAGARRRDAGPATVRVGGVEGGDQAASRARRARPELINGRPSGRTGIRPVLAVKTLCLGVDGQCRR